MGDRHDDLLKRIHIVAISHALIRPRDVDISDRCQSVLTRHKG